jgi:streptogramin lyase
LEDRCLLSLTISEFPVPTANSRPFEITAGPDGNLWFTETNASKIGMTNPNDPTRTITEFPIPTTNLVTTGITTGPDGNLWFGEFGYRITNKIGMINPTTHFISEFTIPTTGAEPEYITAGPDGNLWFTEYVADKIGMINPATHAISEFPVPTAGAYPTAITAGPDGNLWFAESSVGKIGMINPATHVISEFAISSNPGGITAGPDGNLWFTDSGKIGEINPTTHAITEFSLPSGSTSDGNITAAPDGNLWFTEYSAGKIGEINPTNHAITEYAIPYANTYPLGITAGPAGIWFTDYPPGGGPGPQGIGLATLATSQLVVTQQPPSSIAAGSPFGLTVTAEDSSGNPITSFNGTVTVGLENNPGCATLGGTLTATASNGVATCSGLSMTKAASGYTLYASSDGYGWGITNAVTVTPAAPSQLVLTRQPSAAATAGQPFATQPVVSEEDAYGNVVTGDNSTVITAALASGAGPLQETTSVTISGGVATFTNLADNKAETLTLQFSCGGLTSSPSSAIVVSPAAATQLVITQQPPANVVVNTGFGLVVAVEDAYGNVVPSASYSVSVALANNPTGARLSGTTKVTASQGLATFTGLSLNKVGTGYTLQVSSKGLTSATTNPFNVVSSATSGALAVTTTARAPDPLVVPVVLDSPDLWDAFRPLTRRRGAR